MEREYELFEFTDGFPVWRDHASGLHEAIRKLHELTLVTTNECFAMYLPTKEIVARVNVPTSKGKPTVFQITYDYKRATARAETFRLHGYEVITVIGNDAAKVVLSVDQECDLFIVGHAAPEETRRDMVAWLKAHYPGVRVLALNPPSIPALVGADYNATLNGPETLLPVMASAVNDRGGSGTSPIN